MTTARFNLAVGVVNEKLIAVGGHDGSKWLATVEVLQFEAPQPAPTNQYDSDEGHM